MQFEFPAIDRFFRKVGPRIEAMTDEAKSRFVADVRKLGDDGLVRVWTEHGVACAAVSDEFRAICRRHGVLPQ